MKRMILMAAFAATAACEDGGGLSLPAADGGASGGSSGFREFLVLGSSMSFEQCRSRGGLIIQDRGSPMVACDPRVIRTPVPAGERDTVANQEDSRAAAEAADLAGS